MASSSASDDSHAPENFQLSSNEEDISDILTNEREKRNVVIPIQETKTTRKCPVCTTQQWKFYCMNCITNGNIYHSDSHRIHSESLSEKREKLMNIQASLKIFANRYDRLISERKAHENIQFEIKQKRQQIQLLHQQISLKKEKIEFLKEKRDQLNKANTDKSRHLPNYPIKVNELSDFVLDRIEKINTLRDKHNQLLDNLQKTTRCKIQKLVEYVFPIDEIVLKDELPQRKENTTNIVTSEESETIAALAEAKNTSYIRGKWVFHGSSISEVQYRIVAPSLPANGDYTAYLDWLSENKDEVPKTSTDITPSRINGFRIAGALTYTAQLTHLISYYLNVRLPYKLAYGDFCKKLSEEQFRRKVTLLNSNIMYLAYTQQVKLRELNENHTLENILVLLDLNKSNLGRHGFTEVGNAPLNKSVDSLLLGIETATESESEDENSLRLDWEAVPNVPHAIQQEIMNSNLLPYQTGAQQSTIKEGLMTAAVHHISSMFKWMK